MMILISIRIIQLNLMKSIEVQDGIDIKKISLSDGKNK